MTDRQTADEVILGCSGASQMTQEAYQFCLRAVEFTTTFCTRCVTVHYEYCISSSSVHVFMIGTKYNSHVTTVFHAMIKNLWSHVTTVSYNDTKLPYLALWNPHGFPRKFSLYNL